MDTEGTKELREYLDNIPSSVKFGIVHYLEETDGRASAEHFLEHMYKKGWRVSNR